MASGPSVSRAQILAFRRTSGHLDGRLGAGKRSLRKVAWAGLQDSMPRAAVLSIHARVAETPADVWADDAFVQVWGPRYSVFVVARQDLGIFTLGRLTDSSSGRERAYRMLAELEESLDEATGVPSGDLNRYKYAAPTGRVVVRWDGARRPTVRLVDAPDIDPVKAREELVRRYLHVFGPSTPEAFAAWAGLTLTAAGVAFDRLRRSLTRVRTPLGEGWGLNADVDRLLSKPAETREVRLLPSGDAYYLLHGEQRRLLVPRAERRDLLWTSRVWPGAILAGGEIVGTWRRTKQKVTALPWKRISQAVRHEIEAEAQSLPLPDDGAVRLEWGE